MYDIASHGIGIGIMDVAYNQHSDRARRKSRSSTNLNHLSLAPLTVKLPLNDDDDDSMLSDVGASAIQPYTSYLQGKSAPTTPRLLSRSPVDARSRSREPTHHRRTPSAPSGPITKSKSSSHLASGNNRHPASGQGTPRRRKDDAGLTARDRNDSDWLLRAGAAMTSEAREYKGQAWLVSRQSSTSLSGGRDPDEEAFEQELAREREMTSRLASRRGSSALADDEAASSSARASRLHSRSNSRSHSLAGTRSHMITPLDRPGGGDDDSYFGGQHETFEGPDFVNLDEKLEELERDTSLEDDEAAVRRLVRRGQNGKGTWVSNVIGWSLFSVEENDEDSSEEAEDDSQEDAASRAGRAGWSDRHFEGVSNAPEEKIPPPTMDEGKWKDAAWLLSVAAKVMF